MQSALKTKLVSEQNSQVGKNKTFQTVTEDYDWS